MRLDCGHDLGSGDGHTTVCGHLRVRQAAGDVKKTIAYFTGSGIEYDVVCVACAQAKDAGAAVDVFAVCKNCLRGSASGFMRPSGSAGAPEILEDLRPLDTRTIATVLPDVAATAVSVAPIDNTPSSWLVLVDDGRILRWDIASGVCEAVGLTRISASDLPADAFRSHQPARRIIASPDGRYAAVVVDYGSRGEVLDLADGRSVLSLDGGTYESNTVPFAAAFIRWRGRDVIIHRTEWNRLDATDLPSGRNLTARTFEGATPGDPAKREGDFSHGALHVDPTCSRIADDGWIWHPFGSVVTWEVEPWLASNPFESEDGPSRALITEADWHWDRACVWLDKGTLAVGGIGDDDDLMIPGAQIFDVSQGAATAWRRLDAAEVRAFAGPGKPFFAAHGLLYAVGSDGLDVWDPAAGTRLGHVAGFRPNLHHRGAGQLADFGEGRLRTWRITDPRGEGADSRSASRRAAESLNRHTTEPTNH